MVYIDIQFYLYCQISSMQYGEILLTLILDTLQAPIALSVKWSQLSITTFTNALVLILLVISASKKSPPLLRKPVSSIQTSLGMMFEPPLSIFITLDSFHIEVMQFG